MDKQAAINKFKSFLDSISADDNVCILHDTDMDGFAAGVLAKKGLELAGKHVAVNFPKEHGNREVSELFLNTLKEHDCTHIVCVDLNIADFSGSEKLSDYQVLILDHHPNQSTNDMVTIFPHNIQDRVQDFQFCAAHLVYTLFHEVVHMQPHDWIATCGIISDMTYPHHQDFLKAVFARHGWKTNDDIFETEIATLVKQVGYGCSIGTSEVQQIIFKSLDTAKNYQEAISHMHAFDVVKAEQDRLLEEFSSNKETHGKLHFYEFKTPYGLNSAVSTILSKKQIGEHDILVTLCEKNDGTCSASARRQDLKMHMGDMLRECVAEFPNSNGGGHIPAAGAKFPSEYKEKFKENILTWVKAHEQ